eukprot:1793516-Pleurochrysis_carterae.AAC.2
MREVAQPSHQRARELPPHPAAACLLAQRTHLRQHERALALRATQQPFPLATLDPNAVTGSPTTTLAGAACSPNSASPATASCACTYTRVPGAAGSPPAAHVCTASITTCDSRAGVGTLSAGAAPVKSSMKTFRYLGAV